MFVGYHQSERAEHPGRNEETGKPPLLRARGHRATMVVSVIAKYMQGYKQFGWKAALTKMYTVSIRESSRLKEGRGVRRGPNCIRGVFRVFRSGGESEGVERWRNW